MLLPVQKRPAECFINAKPVLWHLRSQKVLSGMCLVALASVASSPEFIELIGAQGGNERTGQLRHGSRLHQFQPAVDTPPVAHPL